MLSFLLMTAAIGYLLYLMFLAFVKHSAETLAEFREAPVSSTFTWLGVIGVVTFFAAIVSMGRLTFHIPTPWGYIKSQWASGLLALLSIPAFYFRPRRIRRSKQ